MAYGTNLPFGLTPISSINGGTWTEKYTKYNIFTNPTGATTYGTSIFTGDPVAWNSAVGTTVSGVPTIMRYPIDNATVANESLPVLGVFWGCEYTDSTGKLVPSDHWPASTQVLAGSSIDAFIIDDPNVIWEIQVSTATDVANDARFGGTVNTAATPGYFGQNFAFGLGGGGANLIPQNPTSGNVKTGQSAIYLNMVGTTSSNRVLATLPLKAISYSLNSQQLGNEYEANGTTARQFLNLRVVINNHVFRVGQLGNTPL